MNYIDQLKVKGIIYSLKDASVAALVNAKIQELIGTAPENLNTLQELAAALLNNDDALEGIITTLASKTSKEYVDNLFNTIQLTPGPKGDTGEKGDKGDTGATGPQGPKGDTGETGAKGDQGIQGPKGDTGADGKSAYEIYKSTVNEQEAQPAIYAFESWNNSSKDIKYGEGQAKVVELRAGGATIEVISNTSTDPNAEDFVGRQFNIPTALATDEPIQLHTLENEPVNIWVTVTLIQEAQDAVVAMTESEWLASLNGTVDTTNFYTKAEVDSNIRSNIGDLGLMIVNDSYDIRMNLTNPPIENIVLGKALLTGNLHSEIGDNNVETTYAELWVVEGTSGNEQMGGTQTIVPEMELKLYVPYPIVENEPLKAYRLVNSLEGDGEVVSDFGADAILSNFTAEHTRNKNVFEFTKEVSNQLSTSTNSLISDIRNTMNALLNNKANKTEIVKSYNDLKDRPFDDWNDTAEDAELVTVIALHDLHKKYEFLKSEIERLHNIVYTD